MTAFIIVNLILLGLILILLLLLSGLWPPDSPWAPWWQMPKETVRKMCTYAKVSEKSVIYDLGSGTGNALIIAAREFGSKGIGIEIDPLRYAISLVNNKRYGTGGEITFIKKNFFSTPLSPATVIFIYLIPAALKRLTPKFLDEVTANTIFVSYVYPMPVDLFHGRLKLVKHDKEYRIFVYRMQKEK